MHAVWPWTHFSNIIFVALKISHWEGFHSHIKIHRRKTLNCIIKNHRDSGSLTSSSSLPHILVDLFLYVYFEQPEHDLFEKVIDVYAFEQFHRFKVIFLVRLNVCGAKTVNTIICKTTHLCVQNHSTGCTYQSYAHHDGKHWWRRRFLSMDCVFTHVFQYNIRNQDTSCCCQCQDSRFLCENAK